MKIASPLAAECRPYNVIFRGAAFCRPQSCESRSLNLVTSTCVAAFIRNPAQPLTACPYASNKTAQSSLLCILLRPQSHRTPTTKSRQGFRLVLNFSLCMGHIPPFECLDDVDTNQQGKCKNASLSFHVDSRYNRLLS